MLEAFGLPESAARIYRTLLQGGRRVPDLLREFDGDPAMPEVLGSLLKLSLVRFSREDPLLMEAVNPSLGLRSLLAQFEQRLRNGEEEVVTMRRALDRLSGEYWAARSARSTFDEVRGGSDLTHRIEELAHEATVSVRAFGFEPDVVDDTVRASAEAFPAVVTRLRRRGIDVRCICHDSSRQRPEAVDFLRTLDTAGATVCTVPALTAQLLVFDEHTALLFKTPHTPHENSVEVQGAVIMQLIHVLFEQTWRTGVELTSAPPRGTEGLRPVETELLRLLADGLTDEAAARRLGVSLRTVRRWASEISSRLGAASRFQAGILARQRGWV